MPHSVRRHDWEGTFAGFHAHRAIIDIGSNTVRMVLYGGSPRAPTVLLNEKVVAQLGRDIARTGELAPEAMELAFRALRRFRLLLADLGVREVETVATAAVREASNADIFLKEVRAAGLSPRVLSGEDEAATSAMGVIGAFGPDRGIVADLGGGSLELVGLDKGEVAEGVSLPLGTLRLREMRARQPGDQKKSAGQVLKAAAWQEPREVPLYLVGGTWRALAVYACHSRNSALTDPHGFTMSAKEARALADEIASLDTETMRQVPRISSMRADSLPDAAALLRALMKRLEPSEVVISAWGLREGLLYRQLEPYQRAQDPLLAGVAVFGAMHGAPPVLATRVAGWTVDAIPPRRHGSERLRLAATTLALASMRVEPNLRRDLAVDWAMHKRWIGIDAEGRAMLAAASLANGNDCEVPDSLRELARPDCVEEAVCWGLAVRLCRRLGGRSRASLQASSLGVEEGTLVLRLADSHAELYGLATEKDMKLLAGRMKLNHEVRIVSERELAPAPDAKLVELMADARSA